MRRLLSLILPVLAPSWRFFDRVTATPWIEIAEVEECGVLNWRPYYREPERFSVPDIFLRLAYSPNRNEALFLASCAERAAEGQSLKLAIIADRLLAEQRLKGHTQAFRFRILFPTEDGGEVYRSDALRP